MTANQRYSPWIHDPLTVWSGLLCPRYLVRVKGKTVIYNQEEEIEYVYIVKSGRVRLSYFTPQGQEKIYFFCIEGALFGEESCFSPESQFLHGATIVDCQLYKIPKNDFLEALSQNKDLNAQVIHSMAHKTYVVMEQVRRMSFLDARQRLAATFVDLCQVFGVPCEKGIKIELPIIQQGLANLVKTSRLTVNKTIVEFEKQGVLEKKNQRFLVYDLPYLESLSQIREN